MKFRKLTIENYKSIQFATEIRFPVGDDGRSIFLIGGMNGASKTSIMEAINFCLYGAKLDEIFRIPMSLPPSIEKALTLPVGARFYRCALQVNPFFYVKRHSKTMPFDSEAAYNAALIQSCKDTGRIR